MQRSTFKPGKFYQRARPDLSGVLHVAIATMIGAVCLYSPQDLAFAGANLADGGLVRAQPGR